MSISAIHSGHAQMQASKQGQFPGQWTHESDEDQNTVYGPVLPANCYRSVTREVQKSGVSSIQKLPQQHDRRVFILIELNKIFVFYLPVFL